MSKKKDNPGRFMTQAECYEMMNPLAKDVAEIKEALVGQGLQRGGIVKDLADIKAELKQKANRNDLEDIIEKKKWSRRDKALILVAIIGVLGSIITALINTLKP